MSCSNNNNSCSNPIKVPKKTINVMCTRKCTNINEQIKLKMLFTDDCGKPIDPAGISITLEDPDGNTVDPGLQASKIDVGYWYTTYTPAIAGDWKDIWVVSLAGENVEFVGGFSVNSGGQVAAVPCGLDFNSLIVVKLHDEIADTDGNTLEKNSYVSFSTEYNPFYASVEMLRMEMGSWAALVPDDTIALAIHWSSLEANNITGVRPTSERYFFARSRFVMYDAAIKLFSMPMGISSPGSGKQKQLGDLMIENGDSLDFQIKDLIEELKAERDEWWRVVNAGGCIVPGQGLGPTMASKGGSLTADPKRSREWHDPWEEHYLQPTRNSLYRKSGQKKYKHGYTGWNEYYFTSVKRGIRKGRR
jgi:hypothetical protein